MNGRSERLGKKDCSAISGLVWPNGATRGGSGGVDRLVVALRPHRSFGFGSLSGWARLIPTVFIEMHASF